MSAGALCMSMDVLVEPQPAPVAAPQRPVVLIIDDDEALSETLALRLQRQGFDPLVASTGEEGLDQARSQLPNLIVLDLHLPDTDGFTVCQHLVDSSETCCIPVIVLSGMERPDIVRRCRSAGSQYFIRKPYDPSALMVLIRQAISEAQSWYGG
jgi:DNA-binding response OmpR family regulator